jgi:hypothetical protein
MTRAGVVLLARNCRVTAYGCVVRVRGAEALGHGCSWAPHDGLAPISAPINRLESVEVDAFGCDVLALNGDVLAFGCAMIGMVHP